MLRVIETGHTGNRKMLVEGILMDNLTRGFNKTGDPFKTDLTVLTLIPAGLKISQEEVSWTISCKDNDQKHCALIKHDYGHKIQIIGFLGHKFTVTAIVSVEKGRSGIFGKPTIQTETYTTTFMVQPLAAYIPPPSGIDHDYITCDKGLPQCGDYLVCGM